MSDPKYQVTDLQKIDAKTLGITWQDGLQRFIPVRQLRLKCPCAKCVDEMTGKILLVSQLVPIDVHPVKIEPVGLYALKVFWSDGHDTGMYTFKMLRELDLEESESS